MATNGRGKGDTLLDVEDLQTHFFTESGVVKAVDGVTWDIKSGENLALVGESGSGKSVSALSVMRLVASPPGRIVGGKITFEGNTDILSLSDEKMRGLRGNKMAMIFQEPMTSLNPVLTILRQLTEPLELHMKLDKVAAKAKAIDLLLQVGIPDAARRVDDYPHQFSGGMRQRVMIAMGLACNPKLLIADEPTTALDVTIQAQVLEVINNMAETFGNAVLLITHNLGVVARYAQRVNVMYAGHIVEQGVSREIYGDPRHPYTLGLLQSVPRLDEPKKSKLLPIEGQPPDMIHLPAGCPFRARCRYSIDRCAEENPPLIEMSPGHLSACWVDVTEATRRV